MRMKGKGKESLGTLFCYLTNIRHFLYTAALSARPFVLSYAAGGILCRSDARHGPDAVARTCYR